MNLLDILEENKDIILAEAVKINNGKEAWELIKSNKIGVKLDPSYKFNDDETDKIDTIIMSMDKMIKSVGANNAPFAVQLAVNKVPLPLLKNATKLIPDLVKFRNRPWAKQVPGYSDIINLNSKEKLDARKWIKVAEDLEIEEQNHGHSNRNEVEEIYNDGTWTMYVPRTWKGAKSVSFYGKKGEIQTPTEWCTRADKSYYDMYSENSPLYIIRNWETGKSYQIAFDKANAYVLDQKDTKGDKFTNGDLEGVPDKLLSKIKWNGRTLLDFKKEGSRTERRNGELENPTSDFKDAKWEAPKDEGNGIVSQSMKNLHNDTEEDKFTTFMVKGKPFKFDKRNNYAKRYYYKRDPGYVVITVLSKNGNIRGDILWAFDIHNGKFNNLNYNEFNRLVGDNGYLLQKVKREKDTADQKREFRANNKRDYEKNKGFVDKMAKILTKHIKKQYVKDGIIDKSNGINIETAHRNKNLDGNGGETFGNFMPIGMRVEVYAYDGNYYNNEVVACLDFDMNNMKCTLGDQKGIKGMTNELKETLEKSTTEALKKYYKEAMKDSYGLAKRAEYREKSKGIAAYDTNKSRKLQFEDYFPY